MSKQVLGAGGGGGFEVILNNLSTPTLSWGIHLTSRRRSGTSLGAGGGKVCHSPTTRPNTSSVRGSRPWVPSVGPVRGSRPWVPSALAARGLRQGRPSPRPSEGAGDHRCPPPQKAREGRLALSRSSSPRLHTGQAPRAGGGGGPAGDRRTSSLTASPFPPRTRAGYPTRRIPPPPPTASEPHACPHHSAGPRSQEHPGERRGGARRFGSAQGVGRWGTAPSPLPSPSRCRR